MPKQQARMLINLGATTFGVIYALIGVGSIIGGKERLTSATWRPLVDLCMGHYWIYSIMWSLGGLLILAWWDYRVRLAGYGVIAAVSFLWSGLFVVAAFEQWPQAAIHSIFVYGGYGFCDVLMAVLTVQFYRE